MRVKALFLVSLFLLTWVSTIARAEFKHNFLLGGEAGIESRRSEFTSRYQIVGSGTVLLPANQSTVLNHVSTRIVDAGSFLGLLGGWQFQCKRWLAGIEGTIDFHSFEEHKDIVVSDVLFTPAALIGLGVPQYGPAAATVEYNRGTVFGLNLRGGYWITPFFLGYVKAGIQFSRDELTFSIPIRQIAIAPGPGGFLGEPAVHEKDDIWGFMGGVGIEIPAFGPSSVRVEYNYVRTDRFVVNDAVGSMVGVHRAKYPESHIGKVAWVWNFK